MANLSYDATEIKGQCKKYISVFASAPFSVTYFLPFFLSIKATFST